MLVLSRKLGESIVIGEHIRVTVLAIRGNKVRLGFTAPDEVTINREEVLDQITQTGPVSESAVNEGKLSNQ